MTRDRPARGGNKGAPGRRGHLAMTPSYALVVGSFSLGALAVAFTFGRMVASLAMQLC